LSSNHAIYKDGDVREVAALEDGEEEVEDTEKGG
jgi:hypothetical protein